MNNEGNAPGCDVEAVVAKMDLWAEQRTVVQLIHLFAATRK